ncbi:MAG TPA: TonB-dependent receptor [Bryobacteraceae bacterium]|nr:TonB-dependent receptor [Bryobacteraceae bacterium]
MTAIHSICVFAFAVLVGATSIHAAELRGKVLDPSGAVAPGARVSLVQTSTGSRSTAVTGSDGTYAVAGLIAGEYLVEAQAAGFGVSQAQRVSLEGTGSESLDLSLELLRVSTQVQVTAAGGAQTVDEQAKALTVVDSLQINDRAEYSIAETIRSVPGVRVQQLGGPGSFTRIQTRGMRGFDTAVLIDGFRLRDAGSPQGEASGLIGDLLVVNTDRVEVLRGSGASLYGTHATGGLINVITATAESGFHGEVGAEGGGLGSFRGITRLSGSTLEDRIRFSGGVTHLNVTKGIDGNDRTRNSAGQGLVQYRFGPRTEISGRVLANESFVQLNDTPFAASGLPSDPVVRAVPNVTFVPSPDDPDSRRGASYVSGLVALSHQWSPAASMRISYQGLTTSRDNRDGPGGTRFEPSFTTSDRFDGRLDTVQARGDFHAGSHWLTAGYEFEREAFDNRSRNEFAPPAELFNARLQIDQSSHAAFAQDQMQFLDRRLQVSLSGRVQGYQLEDPRFSDGTSVYRDAAVSEAPRAVTGDASVAYFVQRTGTKARAHIGNGFRSPALYERFGGAFFGGFSVFGDPALKPERLLAFDFGFDQYLGSRTKVSATYFYTRIQEAIAFDFSGAISPSTDPFGRFGGYRNTNGGLARGVELSVETNPIRSMTVRSAYTYTNADERRSIFSTGNIRSIRVSDHMFAGTVTQRFGRTFDATFDLFAASDYLLNFGTRAFSFRGPVKADLAVNYTHTLTDRTSLRLFTRIDNVLNRTYYEDGFRTPKAWATVGMRLLF